METIRGMNDFRTMIGQFRNEVELVITGLERFTSVMQAISDVKKTAVQAEVQFKTYQVRAQLENISKLNMFRGEGTQRCVR